jgi:SpoVK/Ycf46/Vps4 family AAA+-type ATPase
MLPNDELALLIKSKYPVVFVESIDEEYVVNLEKFDCKLLAEKAADFSGAEIEQAIISALYRASSEKEPISTNHILEQMRSTKPLALLKQEEITFLREWAKERTIPA